MTKVFYGTRHGVCPETSSSRPTPCLSLPAVREGRASPGCSWGAPGNHHVRHPDVFERQLVAGAISDANKAGAQAASTLGDY